jgi:4'-phosphopantetheinyl transferase
MTKDDDTWVREHFAAAARDWTPAFARAAARVVHVPISRDPETTRRCIAVLSAAELSRADRFVTVADAIAFKQRRAFRRYCGALALESERPLSTIVFEHSERGRPYLAQSPDIWFSFSSCSLGFLGAWSTTHAIGVDVEDSSRGLEPADLARQFFSKAEADAVERLTGPARLRLFYQLWSLKEAALKSIGEGLPFGLDAFEFEVVPTLRLVHAPEIHGGPTRFKAGVIERDEGCGAVVVRGMA